MTHRLVAPDEADFAGLASPRWSEESWQAAPRILGFVCLVSANARRACGCMEEAVRAGKCDDISEPIEECFVELERKLT